MDTNYLIRCNSHFFKVNLENFIQLFQHQYLKSSYNDLSFIYFSMKLLIKSHQLF